VQPAPPCCDTAGPPPAATAQPGWHFWLAVCGEAPAAAAQWTVEACVLLASARVGDAALSAAAQHQIAAACVALSAAAAAPSHP